jgi:hypothetical protein
MRSAAHMKEYFATAGLRLEPGHFSKADQRGWSIGPAANFPVDRPDHLIHHFQSLREVEGWWRHKAAQEEIEKEILRRLLKDYRTASADELEAIWHWSGKTSPIGPRPEGTPGVPGWLTSILAHHWDCTRFSVRPPTGQRLRLSRGWRGRAIEHYRRTRRPDGFYMPGSKSIYAKLEWLCRRACRERLHALAKATASTRAPRRI